MISIRKITKENVEWNGNPSEELKINKKTSSRGIELTDQRSRRLLIHRRRNFHAMAERKKLL